MRWRHIADGRVNWPTEGKFLLLKQIEKHMVLLKNEAPAAFMTQKQEAWRRVYKALVKAGMPDMPLERVKSVWATMREKAHSRCLNFQDNNSSRMPDALDLAVEALMRKSRLSNGIVPKEEPSPRKSNKVCLHFESKI